MSIDIQMPALSPTMEKGTLAKWLVAEGDTVRAGDLIAEIETDKATMEVEATDDGRVGRLIVEPGTADVPVGEVIAVLLEDGEDSPRVTREERERHPESTPIPPASADPQVGGNDNEATRRAAASPLVRRIAAQSEIDLGAIKGSGPGGRIVKRDLEGTAKLRMAEPAPAVARAPQPTLTPPKDIPFEEVRLTPMRKVIAARMVEAKTTVPHFYLSVDVTLDKLLKLRREINEGEDVKLSVNDFFIRALAIALTKVPEANVQFGGDRLYRFSQVDVSVAVAIDGGLITPVVRDAGSKGLGQISADMEALAEKARAGKLLPEEYRGGTVSLSNLGMYGIKQFDAVINPPQAAILAVGGGEERVIMRNGEIVAATQMTATLSCDHRAIDGAIGAKLLTAFRDFVEEPLKLLI